MKPNVPPPADVPRSADAIKPGGRFAGWKVLVVEDEATTRSIVRTALESWGIAVEEVSLGDRAVPAVLRWKPDLLLLDLYLPGKDGFEILRELRQRELSTEVIVMSDEQFFQEFNYPAVAVAMGAHRFLRKPFTAGELEATLANLPLPKGANAPRGCPALREASAPKPEQVSR